MKRLLLVSFISLSAVLTASAQTGKHPAKGKQSASVAAHNQKMVLLKKQDAKVNAAAKNAKDLQISKGVLNTAPANRR